MKPFRSESEARENGRKGGVNSGKSRRNKADIKAAMEYLLAKSYTLPNGKKSTGAEQMAFIAFQKALKGDWKAWELVRDTAGQKPKEKESSTVTVNNLFDVLQAVDTSDIVIPEIGEDE